MPPPVIDQVFVDLVGYRYCVELDTKIRNDRELLAGEYSAGRIVGRVEDNGLGSSLERSSQLVGPETVVRRAYRNPHRDSSCKRNAGMVVLMSRFQNNHSFPRIYNCDQTCDDRLGDASSDGHVALRIHTLVVEAPALVCDCLSQCRLAPRHAVLVAALPHSFFGGGNDFGRRVEVGKALREENRALLDGIPSDGAYDRFLKIFQSVGSVRHERSRVSKCEIVRQGLPDFFVGSRPGGGFCAYALTTKTQRR